MHGAVQSFNLVEMWHSMGIIAKAVVVLLVMLSMYSSWVIVERAVMFRRVQGLSLDFVLKLQTELKKRDLSGALAIAKRKPQSPLAKVVEGALLEYQDLRQAADTEAGKVDFDPVELVTYAVDRIKDREISALKKGLGGLASISSAAPFIGLFGTVVGIINAFQSMATSGAGGLGSVSKGISEALFTTAVGLAVAIPAVMAFNYFTNVIEHMVVDFNDVSSELISYVMRQPVRAGGGGERAFAEETKTETATAGHFMPSEMLGKAHASEEG